MSDFCITLGVAALLIVVARMLLGLRDAIQGRLAEERLPVEDRIRRIREESARMVAEFQSLKTRVANEGKLAKHGSWIDQVIDYYARLGALAASPCTRPEECRFLAVEATNYLRQNRLKGPGLETVPAAARRLASLLEKGSLPRSGQLE